MKISTKGRYALRLMIDVAVHGGEEFVSLKDVAARQGISMKYLEQIAGLLGKAGFLRSGRGALGGYRLTKAPEEYTLGSILRLTEGNLAPVACLETEENACERCGVCPTLDFWTGLYAAVNEYVDRFTLAESGAGGIGETGESVPTLHRLNGKTPASYRGRRLFEKQVSPSARRSRRAVRRASPARGRARGGRPPGFPWPPWESRGDSR